jgi:hypothetical protein
METRIRHIASTQTVATLFIRSSSSKPIRSDYVTSTRLSSTWNLHLEFLAAAQTADCCRFVCLMAGGAGNIAQMRFVGVAIRKSFGALRAAGASRLP